MLVPLLMLGTASITSWGDRALTGSVNPLPGIKFTPPSSVAALTISPITSTLTCGIPRQFSSSAWTPLVYDLPDPIAPMFKIWRWMTVLSKITGIAGLP